MLAVMHMSLFEDPVTFVSHSMALIDYAGIGSSKAFLSRHQR